MQARKIIGAVNGVWWSKDITKNGKKIPITAWFESVLTYRVETWSLYEGERRRINAIEMDALRRSARISNCVFVYVCLTQRTCKYIYPIQGYMFRLSRSHHQAFLEHKT
jgi:hypothetical protein